eukprot:2267603-Rhodomonas_salina.1
MVRARIGKGTSNRRTHIGEGSVSGLSGADQLRIGKRYLAGLVEVVPDAHALISAARRHQRLAHTHVQPCGQFTRGNQN